MATHCISSRSDYRSRGCIGESIDTLPRSPCCLAIIQRQLADEGFSLFDVSSDYEFKYSSIKDLVCRIEEVCELIDVNTLSEQSDTLLMKCVSSFHLGDEDPDSQVRLVQFLLESGADPNIEDSLGETALDWLLDCRLVYKQPLTKHQRAMIELLVDFGGRVHLMDNQGRRRQGSRRVHTFPLSLL